MQKIFSIAARVFEAFTKKRLLYIAPNPSNALGRTAAKAKAGFWYTGNVYDSGDIAYGIAQNGVVEVSETEVVATILKTIAADKRPVVYDIGANTGYYSLLSAFTYNAEVYAFEPLPVHVECLQESAKLNRLTEQVKVFTCGLGDKDEKKEFYLGGSGSSFDPNFLGVPKTEHQTVPVWKLDNLAKNESLPDPDFIKIDVEGYELMVLRGAAALIEKAKPVLFIEIGSAVNNLNYTETFAWLHDQGYQPYSMVENQLLPFDSNQPHEALGMYLCLHTQTPENLRIAIADLHLNSK